MLFINVRKLITNTKYVKDYNKNKELSYVKANNKYRKDYGKNKK